jgi:hypothetical protein
MGTFAGKLTAYVALSAFSCIAHLAVRPYDERYSGLLDMLEGLALFAVFTTHVCLQVSVLLLM